ncbi:MULTISPECIES: hypothetical protein [Burkholderia]|nr:MULTISPECIES: hypothetical protein [Burkholderia]
MTRVSPDGTGERAFAPGRTPDTGRAAALDGPRAGTTRIGMRQSNTFMA